MKKFFALIIAILVISCEKSQITPDNQNQPPPPPAKKLVLKLVVDTEIKYEYVFCTQVNIKGYPIDLGAGQPYIKEVTEGLDSLYGAQGTATPHCYVIVGDIVVGGIIDPMLITFIAKDTVELRYHLTIPDYYEKPVKIPFTKNLANY